MSSTFRRASHRPRRRLLRVDPILLDGLSHPRARDRALGRQALECRERHPAAVDLEEVAELAAVVGAAEALRAEHAGAPAGGGAGLVGGGADGGRGGPPPPPPALPATPRPPP